ncbi:MAG: ribonuclease R [Vicinamibacterales bacterium]
MARLDRHALLTALEQHDGAPLTAKELARLIGLPPELQATLRRELRTMAAEGVIVGIKGARYAWPSRVVEVTGRLQVHPNGTAVVAPDGGGALVAVPQTRRAGAVHADTVVVRVETAADGSRSGRVVSVARRRGARVVGRLSRDRRGVTLVRPFDARLDMDVRVPLDEGLDAADGDMVTVEISRWPGPTAEAAGRIVEVLGPVEAAGVDVDVVLRKHGIPDAHAPDAVAEARARDSAVRPAEIAGRTDFRHDAVVTIDGDTARDFDDAVSVSRLPGGHYRLAVHIADVAHYVPEGSALDLDAYERGTSVYFPDRAIHMFPHELATGVCSLNPHVDRLVQSCVMEVNGRGDVVGYQLHDGVIHSRARMTYSVVHAIVEARDDAQRAAHAALVPMFDLMRELFGILNARRRRRGSIDFDLPEAELIVDEAGAVADIVAAERNVAHRIIEEFMLLANETVAGHLESTGLPALYRVHEAPEAVRLLDFEAFISSLGLSLDSAPGRAVHPRDFQQLAERIRGTPEERPVALLMLRTMQKARYDPVNLGHFGLAAHTYTHFTSPIRRYPDLVVHRLLREVRRGRVSDERRADLDDMLPEIAQHTSAMERRAQDAERELVQWKKVRFMADRLGDVFTGHVSGVAPFGCFVQLGEHFVEGMVPVATMTDDTYRFDDGARVLFGVRSRRVIRLGDTVQVRVARVDLERRQIELVFDQPPAGRASKKPGTPGRGAHSAGPGRGRPPGRSRGRPGRRERAGGRKGRR